MPLVADSRIGTELAGYQIEHLLGRGGMSVVYRADDSRLKRKVALKLLAPELAEDERFRERFLRESQLAASLDHPNVVPVYDAGEVEGLLYLAMRYVPGTDLRARLRRDGSLDPMRALAIAGQIASALDAAHERGLVHRDVKPSNVLLTGRAGDEHCYLADFGLSTSSSDRGVSEPGQIFGTIDYVAPEQIRGADVDGRADVYALACLVYECLAGEVPFRRPSDAAVLYAHLEEPVPQASRRAFLPEEIDAVFERGMAKLPDDRWDTCGDLVDAARSALGNGGSAERVRSRRTRRVVASVATLGAAAAAAVSALLLTGGRTAIARADTLVRIGPKGTPTAGAALGAQPTAVTVCGGFVWVTGRDGRVSELDPTTLAKRTIRVEGTPTDVASVGDLAAVVSGPPERVTIIDAGFGQVSDTVALPHARSSATAVAFGRDVWVANPARRTLDLLDPPYTGIAGGVALSGSPRLVAAGAGAVWAVGGRTMWRIDPGTKRLVASIRLPFAARAVAAGTSGVWLVDAVRDSLVRFDPVGGRITNRIRVGRGPAAVAVGPGAVWVANSVDGSVSEVDVRRNAVVRTISIGARPIDLVVGLGGIWVVRRSS
jgi:YVTN family beta-propeller protein